MNLNFTCLHENFPFGKRGKKKKKDFVGAKVDRFEKRAAMTLAVKKHSNENKRKK